MSFETVVYDVMGIAFYVLGFAFAFSDMGGVGVALMASGSAHLGIAALWKWVKE